MVIWGSGPGASIIGQPITQPVIAVPLAVIPPILVITVASAIGIDIQLRPYRFHTVPTLRA